jgi:multicomponent Na+:H+ antiporter subunit E
MALFLVLNLSIAIFYMVLIGGNTATDLVIGFVLGVLILLFVEPDYGRRVGRIPVFVAIVLWQVLISAVTVAGYVLRPGTVFRQGVVAVPLDVTEPLEITVLASVITLTPGTISVNLGRDSQDRQVLFVHALMLDDPEGLAMDIKNTFERRILSISRGNGGTA